MYPVRRRLEKNSDLRSDGGDARLEITKQGGLAAVVGQLLVVVSDKPDVEVLPQKLRGAPVDVGIDTVLVFGPCVLQL